MYIIYMHVCIHIYFPFSFSKVNGLSMFISMCNYHHHVFPEFFHLPHMKLCPLNSNSPVLSPLSQFLANVVLFSVSTQWDHIVFALS